ncbi:MAG: AAA family ATPase [Gammaproteobacteria bacterium]
MSQSRLYQSARCHREEAAAQLPPIRPGEMDSPEGYLASEDLKAAVEVALTLGMPLLLTGEPGLGKSVLAGSLALELFDAEPLEFVVKSDTQYTDLFYHFDTVGRFHAASAAPGKDGRPHDAADPRRFLEFNGLGRAILHAMAPEHIQHRLGPAWEALAHPGRPTRSVVLIDEIDKAPRDVPNDILTQIDRMQFRIPEISAHPDVGSDLFAVPDDDKVDHLRPIVVITSNSEKALPDPFLRRCVYHHIRMPPYRAANKAQSRDGDSGHGGGLGHHGDVSVEAIVEARLGARYKGQGEAMVAEAIDLFAYLREQPLERIPSLAELLNWLQFLLPDGRMGAASLPRLADMDPARLRTSVTLTLLKKERDQLNVDELLKGWLKAQEPAKA